jgi:uncharacterized membrane protein
MKLELWQAFVLGTILAWGVYVPVLHEGQKELGANQPSAGSVRAFLCVGLAYLFTAVVIPLLLLAFNYAGGERLDFTRDGVFNRAGFLFATLGGVAGAAGALGIILAIKSGGKPIYIVPLVFAGAPIVSTLVSLLWHPPKEGTPDWKFFTGIVLAAIGAGMVLYSKSELDLKKPKTDAQTRNQAIELGSGGSQPLDPDGHLSKTFPQTQEYRS